MHEPALSEVPLHLLFLYFIVYSFLGWCMETVYCSSVERQFVPRGFLLGPICPIYGVGVLMMICWFEPFMEQPVLFYIIATVCMSAWEYLVGWFLEVTTHIKYWDYSMFKFNLKGRICLWVCLMWGVLAYIILFWVHPAISSLVLMVPRLIRIMMAAVLAAVLAADTATTIRKLALVAKLMHGLEELRVQLAAGRSELTARLQEAKEEFSEKLASNARERKARESDPKLQKAYDELLKKGELQFRRFLNRYRAMSSKRYERDLADLRNFPSHLKQRLLHRRKPSAEDQRTTDKEVKGEPIMSIEAVRAYFQAAGLEDRIQEFPVSSATVELAAQALGCAPERIAKTLSFQVDGAPVLIVSAGDAKVDNSRFKGQFHTKAKMLTPEEAINLVGHAVGGVCPFAVKDGVTVYLDESLKRFDTVFPACGSANSAIELTIPELERYSNCVQWVDVCKNWRPEE